MFYHARWYDPTLGRFIQADTVVPGGAQGYDRYAYANNDPVLFADPSGHSSCVGGHADDGPDCAKKDWSDVSYQISQKKHQDECAAGAKQGCQGGTRGMLTMFAASVLTAGTGDYLLASGAGADAASAGFWKAAEVCVGSAVCRAVTGMAGGASVQGAANGETADTIMGKAAHRAYPDILGEPDLEYNQRIPGTTLRPDAIDWDNNIVRELKPDNWRAIQRGLTQLGKYLDALQELTGDPWVGIVDTYPK